MLTFKATVPKPSRWRTNLQHAVAAFIMLLICFQTQIFSSSVVKGNGKIAFLSLRDGNAEIYSMNPDGTNQVRLTNNSADDFSPTWSPDGQKIAFMTNRDHNYEIYVMNADGTGQTRLTNASAVDRDPAWSPDGTKIAFSSNRNGNSFQIWVMAANGSNPTKLTSDTVGNNLAPAWSPDGTRIVFENSTTLHIINVDGSNETAIAGVSGVEASWSPDGTQLVFVSTKDGNSEIYKMKIDGTSQVRLTNNTSSDIFPVWSPDGAKIAFAASRVTNFQVFTMNADGSSQAPLTTDTQGNAAPTWQGVPGFPCPKNVVYWKQNSAAWPVKALTLGSKHYTQTQLLALMNLPPKNDASLNLADELIATKLNIALGAPSAPIQDKVTESDTILSGYPGFLPYHVDHSSTAGVTMMALKAALFEYNARNLTPGCTP